MSSVFYDPTILSILYTYYFDSITFWIRIISIIRMNLLRTLSSSVEFITILSVSTASSACQPTRFLSLSTTSTQHHIDSHYQLMLYSIILVDLPTVLTDYSTLWYYQVAIHQNYFWPFPLNSSPTSYSNLNSTLSIDHTEPWIDQYLLSTNQF